MTEYDARYRTIVADPPWLERGSGKVKRGADRHYPLMATPDIIAAMLQADAWRPADDAHLYLWVTNNYLPDGLQVMAALGFRYVTNIAWIKPRIGLGQYFRGAHELCLFGTRGKGAQVRTDARDIASAYRWDHEKVDGKRVHSGKPAAFFKMVEKRSMGPRLEMFARTSREWWDAWGNEVDANR